MEKISCSIIVPALNAENTIERCIESLLEQESGYSHEIIVIDNGSSDRTPEIVQKYGKKVVHLTEKKKGISNARNKGISKARGGILVFLDSDCYVENDWLDIILQPFKDKNIRAVGGSIGAWEKKNIIQRYCDIFCHAQRYYLMAQVPFFATSNAAIRRSGLVSERFDTRLKICEDADLFYRNNIRKSEMYYEEKARAYHYYSKSLIDFIKKNYLYGRWIRVMEKKTNKSLIAKGMTLARIYRRYGAEFLIIKLIEATSFRIGLFLSF